MEDTSAQYFLSNLSHEIRTPLNGIIGYAQLLTSTQLNQVQTGYITSMNNCCFQLIELVNDILDFSRLSTGKAVNNPECFCINQVVEDVTSAIGCRIREKNQKIHFSIDKELNGELYMDRRKLSQVLINLVSNANKFSPVGGRIVVCIRVKGCSSVEAGSRDRDTEPICTFYGEAEIEDNGIGISEEDQKKLFDPFFQVETSLTKNGTGLGLAISKKLVETLGGEIEVESSKGDSQGARFADGEHSQGSTFRFTFRFEKGGEEIERKIGLLSDCSILVLDDDVDSRITIGEILLEAKANPILCSSIREASAVLSKGRQEFKVGIAKESLVRVIREKKPDLPVIMIGGTIPVRRVELLQKVLKVLETTRITSIPVLFTEKDQKKDNSRSFLIAEDVEYNSEILVKFLGKCGYIDVDVVKNGEQAIIAIQKKKYHVILLDLRMPVLDGFSVATYIMEHKRSEKIIVITASILDADRKRCEKLGVGYFLLKPVVYIHLRSVLDKVFETE